VSEQFFVPAVIKAKRQRGKHLGRFGRVPLNRKNIMLRDGLKCQYCGKRGGSNLTLDHVIPQSKGGPNTWQNLVTACGPCNTRKGDSTLRELRWKLLSQPKEPSPWDMGIILASLGMSDLESVPEEWSTYLFSSGSDTD
jgi:5-methylcytosine-specific restriction endonuclease McrA